MTLSDRLEEQQRTEAFDSPADLEAFFRKCDALEGPTLEPDWHEHLDMMAASRCFRRNMSPTKHPNVPD